MRAAVSQRGWAEAKRWARLGQFTLPARKAMTAPVMRTRIHGARRLKRVRVGFGSTIGGWHELRPRTHPEIVRAKSECLGE